MIKWMVPVCLDVKATIVHQLVTQSAQTFVSTRHVTLAAVVLKGVNMTSSVGAGKKYV